MVFLFGHVGGKEPAEGDPRAGDGGFQISFRRTGLGIVGGSSYREWCEDFSERKLYALAPTTMTHAGVVTLLGALSLVPSPR